jgi:hypothetical protein
VKYTRKQTEVVAKKLRKLPAVARKRAQTPEKAVQMVQDELAALLARGYSVKEVGHALRSAGIEISAVTLRGYASASAANKRGAVAGSLSVAPSKRKAVTRTSTATTATTATTTRTTSSGFTAAGTAAASSKKSAPPASPAKSRATAVKRPATVSAGLRDYKGLQLSKATFVVRPDTPDTDL